MPYVLRFFTLEGSLCFKDQFYDLVRALSVLALTQIVHACFGSHRVHDSSASFLIFLASPW